MANCPKEISKKTNKTDNNKKIALESLKKTLGNISKACEAANVSRSHFYEWVNEDPIFAAAVQDVKDRAIDTVESVAYKLILEEKNPTMTIFYLKTQGKKRGWQENSAVEVTGNLSIQQVTVEVTAAVPAPITNEADLLDNEK